VTGVTAFLLAVAIASGATPVAPRARFNLEPAIVGLVGLVGVGLGAWQLSEAGARTRELEGYVADARLLVDPAPGPDNKYVSLTPAQRMAERLRLLEAGERSHQRGSVEALLGTALVAMGSALVVGSIVWLVVEGVSHQPVALTPVVVPGGGAVVLQARF
jgi:hypothetical protein